MSQVSIKCKCSFGLHALWWTSEWRCEIYIFYAICDTGRSPDFFTLLMFFLGENISVFHIGANIEKLRLLFNINVACKIDVITASQTTFVCVLKV